MWRQKTSEIVDWICIIMFILGTLGNTLGLIVFSSRKFRRATYGRLAIASLVINLLCVAVNYRFFTNRPFFKRYKFYLMTFISLIIVGILTGPTVYFYQPRLIIVPNNRSISQQDISSTISFRYLTIIV
ncbi:unnamed protein product [Rotaria magnacalcarata]|uniref:Uncharacterized protein n=1 Tax=Rotaria magnacalcarata TaxID=392030 RepID=A0A8S3HUC9_9BILA|nr:unnamed protein product [Rotaria magnacalcarata]